MPNDFLDNGKSILHQAWAADASERSTGWVIYHLGGLGNQIFSQAHFLNKETAQTIPIAP